MILSIYLQPGAKQEKLLEQQDLEGNTVFHIWVRARPIDGEANEALFVFLAKHYNVPKSSLQLIRGHTSRYKTVEIKN